jgi:hypothetical protein
VIDDDVVVDGKSKASLCHFAKPMALSQALRVKLSWRVIFARLHLFKLMCRRGEKSFCTCSAVSCSGAPGEKIALRTARRLRPQITVH